MLDEKDLKWALNTASGMKRQLPPKIYKNPVRMKQGNWQLCEAPVTTMEAPIMANMPGITTPPNPIPDLRTVASKNEQAPVSRETPTYSDAFSIPEPDEQPEPAPTPPVVKQPSNKPAKPITRKK